MPDTYHASSASTEIAKQPEFLILRRSKLEQAVGDRFHHVVLRVSCTLTPSPFCTAEVKALKEQSQTKANPLPKFYCHHRHHSPSP